VKDTEKTKRQLIQELSDLRRQIAELKALEAAHKVTEESLVESERMLSTLIGNLPGVVYRSRNDKDWTMEYISDGCFEMTGYKPYNLIGNRVVAWNQLIHVEDRGPTWEQVQAALAKNLPYRVVFRLFNKAGEEKWIWDQGVGVHSTDGRIDLVEGFIIDITDKKRLEIELEKSKNLALLGEFSSVVAHQIRNPLGSILLATKSMQKVLKLDVKLNNSKKQPDSEFTLLDVDRSSLEKNIWDLSEGIDHLNQVVTELLDYTKTLTPRLSNQKIDIILRETFHELDEKIKQNGIHVEEFYTDDLPSVSVDAVLIGQVFRNVIHNSIESMPEGGRLTAVAGLSSQKSNYVSILVSDIGTGIANANVDKIFRPFFTLKDMGVGLGLSLAHRIVEAHGGQITVCENPSPRLINNLDAKIDCALSGLHRGTTIQILLPKRASKIE